MSKFKPGNKIGKYAILDTLGTGNHVTVYLAEQPLIQRKAALMVFDTSDPQKLAHSRQAVVNLALLDHPHIVKLYDAEEAGELIYAAVEYVQGSAISEMLEAKNELPITVVLKIMISIADALDHMHRRGILHGDINTSNIMVSANGEAFLVGFDLAEIVEGDSIHHPTGHPSYLSPEGFQGRRGIHTDLWAFAITLYEILTGHLPYPGYSKEKIEALVRSPEPFDLTELEQVAPTPVSRILECCLSKDQNRRYGSAAELRRALESALDYLESKRLDNATTFLQPASNILLDVAYQEPGIPGQFREYQIIEEVGRGHFSVVYRATDVIGNRQVALKIHQREALDDENEITRFKYEARSLARLRHPNIVQGYNFGQYGNCCFIVMEMLSGVTLERVLDRGFEFEPVQAMVIIAQILNGLEIMHSEGIIHRDIKPANVMLLPERVVVMDMGLAHIANTSERMTQAGEILGTPRYMAPEQARGETLTPQCDLYAVGVMLYEMLSGNIPHAAQDMVGLIFKIASVEADPITKYRNDLPQLYLSYLERMLARRPGDRFPSAQVANQALLKVAGLDISNVIPKYSELHMVMSRTI